LSIVNPFIFVFSILGVILIRSLEGFGDRLKTAIQKKGYTQKELSEILRVNQDTITNYVKEKSFPKADILLNLCDLLDISIDWLMTGKEPTCSGSIYPEEIILLRQDLEMLPLSHLERLFLKKFRKLTEKEQTELKKIIDSKSFTELTPEQLKVINDIVQKL